MPLRFYSYLRDDLGIKPTALMEVSQLRCSGIDRNPTHSQIAVRGMDLE
nr:hypothetical protein Q903MT_gene2258 [Picea sitchensis]